MAGTLSPETVRLLAPALAVLLLPVHVDVKLGLLASTNALVEAGKLFKTLTALNAVAEALVNVMVNREFPYKLVLVGLNACEIDRGFTAVKSTELADVLVKAAPVMEFAEIVVVNLLKLLG